MTDEDSLRQQLEEYANLMIPMTDRRRQFVALLEAAFARIDAEKARAEAAEEWHGVALAIGERIDEAFGVPAPGGPPGYYSMTPDEWRKWALGQLAALRARVAELEAAQQWRPVTEEWPPYLERVVIGQRGGTWAAFARRVRIGAAGDEVWLLDSETTLDFESANVVFSLPPIPPAPEAAES